MNVIFRSRKMVTLWNVFFQYSSIALILVTGIFLIPIYLNFISVQKYGAWLASGNILVWLTLMDSGISTVLQQKVAVAYGSGDTKEIGRLLTSSMLITIIVVVLILFFGLLIADSVPQWINASVEYKEELSSAFAIAVVGTALVIFSSSVSAFSYGLLSSKGIGSISLIVGIAALITSLILLFQGYGLYALAIEILVKGIGYTVGASLYLIFRFHKESIKLGFSKNNFLSLLKNMSYAFFSRAGSALAENIDLFVVSRFLGPESATILAMTKRVPETSRKLVERPTIALLPALSHISGENQDVKIKNILQRLLNIVLWTTGLLMAGFLVFNESFITIWVGEKLFAGSNINLIICFVFISGVMVSTLSNICFSLGNIKGNSIASMVQSIITAFLLYVGVSNFGMIGAVFAPLIAMVLVGAWYYPLAFKRIVHLDAKWIKSLYKETFFVFTVILILSIIFKDVTIDGWIDFIMQVAMFSFIYFISLFVFSKNLRSELKCLLSKLKLVTAKNTYE